MKIRQSFVANSSSSSFIIGADKPLDDFLTESLKCFTAIPHPYAKYSEIKEYAPRDIVMFLVGRLRNQYIHWDEIEKFIKHGTTKDFLCYDKNELYDKFTLFDGIVNILRNISNEIQYSFYEELCEAHNKHDLHTYEDYRKFDEKWFRNKKQYFKDAFQNFYDTYKDKRVYMGEIEDCNSFEAGIEHNELLWDMIKPSMKFSNH